MKLIAVILNIALFLFTCLVLITDGISKDAVYNVFSLLLLLVPIFNLVIILHDGAGSNWLDFHLKRKVAEEQTKSNSLPDRNPVLRIFAIIFNIILLGFSCWAFISQYPHPRESGYILFAVIVFLTPVLSSGVLAFYKR